MKPRLRYINGAWSSAELQLIADPVASNDLLLKVRIGFIQQGTTLHAWCGKNRVVHVTGARQALIGTWNGEKGKALRKRIVREAQIDTEAQS